MTFPHTDNIRIVPDDQPQSYPGTNHHNPPPSFDISDFSSFGLKGRPDKRQEDQGGDDFFDGFGGFGGDDYGDGGGGEFDYYEDDGGRGGGDYDYFDREFRGGIQVRNLILWLLNASLGFYIKF